MAEVVPSMPRKQFIQKWDEWLDGKARKLKQGEDFHCSPARFAILAHAAARRRGKQVETSRVLDGRPEIYVQVVGIVNRDR